MNLIPPNQDILRQPTPSIVEVKKDSLLCVPTYSLFYNNKYDEASDSTSIYSEDAESLNPPDCNLPEGVNEGEETAKIFLKYGLDFNGMPIRTDLIFNNEIEAGAFTPLMTRNGEFTERAHLVLWDYFGGNSCMDLNATAGDTVMVVAEEFQWVLGGLWNIYKVRDLGPIAQNSGNRYMRLPTKWALGRWISSNSTRGFEPNFGLIPESFLVSQKFFNDNQSLFIEPPWYLGIAGIDHAYNYLCEDLSAMRPGLFCIFSPQWLNINPDDYRPFILMLVVKRDPESVDAMLSVYAENALGQWDASKEFKKEIAERARQTMEDKARKDAGTENSQERTAKGMGSRDSFRSAEDERIQHTKIAQAMGKSMLETITRPFTVKTFTIQRNSLGNYLLFGYKYSTLFDLVYDLSHRDSPLPSRLVYGTMTQSMETRILAAVPPPCKMPCREILAMPMKSEQWAARHYDQVTEPSVLSSPIQYVSRTVFDPLKKMHKKYAEIAKVPQKLIDKAMEYVNRYERPDLVDDQNKKKEKKKDKDSKKNKKLQPINKMVQDDFAMIPKSNAYINSDRLMYNPAEPLGQGAFGAVFKGQMTRAADLNEGPATSPVAIKVQTLMRAEKEMRQQWISEVELLANIAHPNVAQMFGFCVSKDRRDVIIVFELLDGSLDSFLKKVEWKISLNEQVDFLQQIARGMSFLHSLDPPIVHGDLATRNVLIKGHPFEFSRYVLKVTDFGISKITLNENCTYYDDPHKIPYKWLPPEVLNRREMNPKADVWAYGITAQELYGIGEPYGLMETQKILPMVKDGHRMERLKMPHFLYEIVLKCWRKQPVDRPSFGEIAQMLDQYYIENECEHIEILLEREKKQLAEKENEKEAKLMAQ